MLDYTELSNNGQGLEQLLREMLFSFGLKVYWSGNGPDGGKDLICIEEDNSIFVKSSKKWLVQCKHKAISGASVGISDLDDIVTSCTQFGCDGYLLVTSTQPSSSVVRRLEDITSNHSSSILATYWDGVDIERKLRTPSQWHIAQHFFPNSASGWQIFSSDRPNHWSASFKGYYFHITNRIGSVYTIHLDKIEEIVSVLDEIELPEGHLLRLRSVFFDDKSGTYMWYVDYLYPYGSEPLAEDEDFENIISGDWCDGFDVHSHCYLSESDHYDRDHYDFYYRYMGQFILGTRRPKQ